MLARIATAVTLAVLPFAGATAQNVADFYQGRNVEIDIGYTPGGGYDLYARMLARHIGKHIPGNPTVVPKNMEGAASLRMTNWLYAAAPKDGSVIGALSRGAAFDPLLGNRGAQFDASKFTWLGSANDEVSVCVALQSSGITRFDDVLNRELTIGSNGVADDTYQFPAVTNAALGTKFKIITGYPGGNDITLALERNEVQGRCGWSWSSVKSTHKSWIEEKKMVVLAQLSLSKHPELPDVPLVMDLAKNDEQRAILKLIFARQVMGRPYLAPPDLPADRIAALRKAFMAAMADKDFLADADKSQLEINPVSGEDVEKLVKEVYATPADIIAKAKAAAK
jgi:tripartite-type tricarboxylate transporter receptor subunit TctC